MSGHLTVCLMPWGRVGSNLLNSIIARGRNVVVYNEPLTRIDSRGRKSGESRKQIWTAQRDWLAENIVQPDTDSTVFLNLSAVHVLRAAAFAKLIAPRKPTYIVLDRRDDLATAVSALRTRAWVDEGAAIGEKRTWAIPKDARVDFRPNIDPKALVDAVQIIQNGRDTITQITTAAKATPTVYYYEDLVFDMTGVVADVFAKSRIPFYGFDVKSGKFGSARLADMVANPDALAKTVADHAIATQLELPEVKP